MEYYLAIKKNRIMPFVAAWIELDSHTKWSKSERERQILYDITYIWNLIDGTKEPFHRKENHGEETCGCQEGRGGSGRDWELGVNRCRMLPSGWICNGILLCSTGNSVQSLMMEHVMWEQRMYTYLCNWVTMLCSRKKYIYIKKLKKTWIDISSRKIYRWSTGTWENAQHP